MRTSVRDLPGFAVRSVPPGDRLRQPDDRGRRCPRELPPLKLADALALLLVLRYPKAAARWHARFVIEAPITLAESQLALCALGALADQHAAPAVAAPERLFASVGRRDLAEVLLRWR